MCSQPWNDLTAAYTMCLQKRRGIAQQSTNDIVSIIQFDDGTRIICERSALSSGVRQLATTHCGGTSFWPALNKALELLSRTTNSYIPVLLFMSDGGGSGGPNEMAKIYQNHHHLGLQVHTIAFGGRADTATLESLAGAGRGKFHKSLTGEELVNTFIEISTQLTSVDGLIHEFAKRVSDAATNKLMLEFL
ncbi:unnamed protein product [Rotaria sp. Silwood2]|nr:unnamed protein product [Rotaria sp. Silwood2]